MVCRVFTNRHVRNHNWLVAQGIEEKEAGWILQFGAALEVLSEQDVPLFPHVGEFKAINMRLLTDAARYSVAGGGAGSKPIGAEYFSDLKPTAGTRVELRGSGVNPSVPFLLQQCPTTGQFFIEMGDVSAAFRGNAEKVDKLEKLVSNLRKELEASKHRERTARATNPAANPGGDRGRGGGRGKGGRGGKESTFGAGVEDPDPDFREGHH